MLLCFQLSRNVLFNWNVDNFKFNFLSRGHLESLNLDRIFLPLFKIIITMLRHFFGNLIFAIIAQMLCGNHFKHLRIRHYDWLKMKLEKSQFKTQHSDTPVKCLHLKLLRDPFYNYSQRGVDQC